MVKTGLFTSEEQRLMERLKYCGYTYAKVFMLDWF